MVAAVVVGAGAAGLAAASRLHWAGVEVQVVEGGGRLGGRVRSEGGREEGAQWVHGEEGNSLHQLAGRCGTLPGREEEWSAVAGEQVAVWRGGGRVGSATMEHLEQIMASIEERLEGEEEVGRWGSQGEYYTHHLQVQRSGRGVRCRLH